MRKLIAGLIAAAATIARPAHAALPVGAKAPDFTTTGAIDGKPFKLHLAQQLHKGPVVLYFFPKAFTSGCTAEAHAFSESIDDFKKAGAQVIGMSADGLDTLKDFSVKECDPEGLRRRLGGAPGDHHPNLLRHRQGRQGRHGPRRSRFQPACRQDPGGGEIAQGRPLGAADIGPGRPPGLERDLDARVSVDLIAVRALELRVAQLEQCSADAIGRVARRLGDGVHGLAAQPNDLRVGDLERNEAIAGERVWCSGEQPPVSRLLDIGQLQSAV